MAQLHYIVKQTQIAGDEKSFLLEDFGGITMNREIDIAGGNAPTCLGGIFDYPNAHDSRF